MTETAAPAAHFERIPSFGTVSCFGMHHRGERPMPQGRCSHCGTHVAWQGAKGRMIDVGMRDGRVAIACWGKTHDCAPHIEAQYFMAEQIWCETNPDLVARNIVRVAIIALEGARPDVVERGGNVEGLDAALADYRAQLAG